MTFFGDWLIPAVTFFADCLIPAVIGLAFMLLGTLKLYGLATGISGGYEQPLARRLCGT